MAIRIDDELLKKILEMRELGYSNHAIEKNLGLYNGCIAHHFGKSINTQGRKEYSGYFTAEDVAMMTELYNEGLSTSAVAQLYNTTRQNVDRYIKRYRASQIQG